MSIETFDQNVRYDDFRSYTTAVRDYLCAQPQVLRMNVRAFLRARLRAETFNNMEPGILFALPSEMYDSPALAMFLLALCTPKGKIFRLCIDYEEVHYVRRSNEWSTSRVLVSSSPRAETLTLVRL